MAAFPATVPTRRAISPGVHSSREFVQVLMKLQRATNLIASTLDLDALLDRVSPAEIAARRAAVPANPPLFEPESQVARVTAMLDDILADL